MELAKITLRGQITIPVGIRKRLGVKDGDKVVFIEENGRIVMENSVKVALKGVQKAFHGEAERAGLKDVDLFVTGDDDFKGVEVGRPEIVSPSEFLERY